MPQHAYWTGHIRLSLVTFPIRLYPAVTAGDKIRLHKYDRETGQRIRYQNINESGEVVPAEDVVKGYEYEKGNYIPVEETDLDSLRQESRHTINLVQFSEFESINPVFYDSPYFVAPDGHIAQEAYLTLREALKESGTVAVGQVVLSSKERIVTIKPHGNGMLMETLRYDYEVRRADDYFSDVPVDADIDREQIDLALELIERKKSAFDASQFRDLYQEGLKEIINARLENRPPQIEEEKPRTGKVVNIIEALRKSLEEGEKGNPDAEKKKPAAAGSRHRKSR